ncbi:integral membrane protein [Colletotrichum tofieldiae]|nr:integral membrane protein [Colletotrichum tofieldiae]GKT76564.1 integral membrane protein [Colletotrichum tofieldiae]GKT87616.1 integral membrane protein [Colletotrichum tofieldiae]
MAIYPYDDSTIDEAKREYLKKLAGFAEDQNLSEDLRPYVRAITIAFTVFAAFVVGLRFTARHLQGAKYLIDDYTMLAALFLLFGNMIMNLICQGPTITVLSIANSVYSGGWRHRVAFWSPYS